LPNAKLKYYSSLKLKNMKKISVTLLFLSITIISFTQAVVRDHRSGVNCFPGQVAATIEPNKWYFIKKAGTNKYIHMAGHKNETISAAILAIEDLQEDRESQQWRFVVAEENGSAIYKLQNRKYAGVLFTGPFELYMAFKDDPNPKIQSNKFFMTPNSDKTWCILTRLSRNQSALSIWTHKSRHCMPTGSEPVIGGRVMKDCECNNDIKRDYVGMTRFTGQIEQKWILQEADSR
jgi:hypothetical protein